MSIQRANWNEKFHELVAFSKREGHCLVPKNFRDNPKLGQWVRDQRTQYTHLAAGKRSHITRDRIQALEKIGFTWQIRCFHSWGERYEQLIEFKAITGHCNVPTRYPGTPKLGHWVRDQRSQYKYLMEGKSSSLSYTRIEALEAIGFVWKMRDSDNWKKKLNELKVFKDRNGHCDVSIHTCESSILRKWVQEQRTQYKYFKMGKRSSLTLERMNLLEDIGLCDWKLLKHWVSREYIAEGKL